MTHSPKLVCPDCREYSTSMVLFSARGKIITLINVHDVFCRICKLIPTDSSWESSLLCRLERHSLSISRDTEKDYRTALSTAKRMNSRCALFVLFLVPLIIVCIYAILAHGASSDSRISKQPPNIVVIMADDLVRNYCFNYFNERRVYSIRSQRMTLARATI